MSDFKNGIRLKLTNGGGVTIKNKIADGGQGTVYRVSYNGADYALKWYHSGYLKGMKPDCKRFYKNLADNIAAGSPSNAFLWPKAIAITGK